MFYNEMDLIRFESFYKIGMYDAKNIRWVQELDDYYITLDKLYSNGLGAGISHFKLENESWWCFISPQNLFELLKQLDYFIKNYRVVKAQRMGILRLTGSVAFVDDEGNVVNIPDNYIPTMLEKLKNHEGDQRKESPVNIFQFGNIWDGGESTQPRIKHQGGDMVVIRDVDWFTRELKKYVRPEQDDMVIDTLEKLQNVLIKTGREEINPSEIVSSITIPFGDSKTLDINIENPMSGVYITLKQKDSVIKIPYECIPSVVLGILYHSEAVIEELEKDHADIQPEI